jgi:hypothetical protein
MDKSHKRYDSTYLMATALDPNYRGLLTDSERAAAEELIIERVLPKEEQLHILMKHCTCV